MPKLDELLIINFNLFSQMFIQISSAVVIWRKIGKIVGHILRENGISPFLHIFVIHFRKNRMVLDKWRWFDVGMFYLNSSLVTLKTKSLEIVKVCLNFCYSISESLFLRIQFKIQFGWFQCCNTMSYISEGSLTFHYFINVIAMGQHDIVMMHWHINHHILSLKSEIQKLFYIYKKIPCYVLSLSLRFLLNCLIGEEVFSSSKLRFFYMMSFWTLY